MGDTVAVATVAEMRLPSNINISAVVVGGNRLCQRSAELFVPVRCRCVLCWFQAVGASLPASLHARHGKGHTAVRTAAEINLQLPTRQPQGPAHLAQW